MTHEEIIEGNKLISIFLWGEQGNPIDRYPEWYIGEDLPYCDEDGYYQNVGAMLPITLEIAQFHSSWDWLMPVVVKINTLAINNFGIPDFTIHSNQSFVYDSDSNEYFVNYIPQKGTLIDSIWLTVIEFIKWYNQNK